MNLLPFERFDQVQSVVKTVNKIYETIDHTNCAVDECKWERYHNDLRAMNAKNEYMDCTIGNVNMGTSRQTRLQSDQNELVVADGINLVKERLSTLAWRMHHDFCHELFDDETKQKIEHCRTICDLKSLQTRINRNGAVTVGLVERAMNRYWSENSQNGKWHFIRSGENIKNYLGGSSKVVGKMLSEPSKLPFMT